METKTVSRRIILFNIERDRGAKAARHDLTGLIESHNPHMFLLDEATQYTRTLATLGMKHIAFSAKKGQIDGQILVRKDVPTDQPKVHQMTADGWTTVRGGYHPPQYMTTVRIDKTATFGIEHFVPSVDWPQPQKRDTRPKGPAERVDNFVDMARNTAKWFNTRPEYTHGERKGDRKLKCVGADFNTYPGDEGLYTPSWITREAKVKKAYPKGRTANWGKGPIDWFLLTPGFTVKKCVVLRGVKEGSDHEPVLLDVEYEVPDRRR